MKRMIRSAALAALTVPMFTLAAQPVSVLFVGNSFTFGRLDPVMSYKAAAVRDLTAPMRAANATGSNPWEPQPWGGVPGIVKRLTEQAGLNYDIALSTRNAASLRGHFLNGNPADWDLRSNIASQKWDVVLLQEQSDLALPAGRGANASLPLYNYYADRIERYIHVGAGESFRERDVFGGSAVGNAARNAACAALTGLSTGSCGTLRTIPANPNASATTKVFLTQTWARPDMVFPHLSTVPDPNYPTVPDGRPIVDTSNPQFPNGFPDTLYYSSLSTMTTDLHASVFNKATSNPNIAGVAPVGDAFQRALDLGVAKSSGFYDANGVYVRANGQGPLNLWWDDYLHASKHGSYLSAMVLFGTITRIDPLSFGAGERAAAELGIAASDALKLQQIASSQLTIAGIALTRAPQTLAQNISFAYDAINALMQPDIAGPAQKNVLLNLLGVAAQYQGTVYRSLALSSLNSALLRVDGCALRSMPDTVITQGGTGMDFINNCVAQLPIYARLKEVQTQLMAPAVP